MKRTILLALALCSASLYAQLPGTVVPIVVQGSTGQAIAGVSVYVSSTQPAGPPYTIPPANLITLCTSQLCTATQAQPVLTDGYGNALLYTQNPQLAWVTIYGTGITTLVYPIIFPISLDSSGNASIAGTFTAKTLVLEASPVAWTGVPGSQSACVTAAGVSQLCLQPDGNFAMSNNGGAFSDLGTAGGAVTSFNGRNGVVVPTTGDYTVAQVTGAAPLASPTFTGAPAAPTPSLGDNSTKLATTAFVILNNGSTDYDASVPTVAVNAAGAGAGGTAIKDNVNVNDSAWAVDVTTAGSPGTQSVVFTLTFGTAHTAAYCTINNISDGVHAQVLIYPSIANPTTHVDFATAAVALASGVTYKFMGICRFIG